MSDHSVTFTLPIELAAAEEELIVRTIAYYKGDKRQASIALGISLKTVYNKLEKIREANRNRVPK